MKVAVIQVDADDDPVGNWDMVEKYVAQAADAGADFIALPELFNMRVGRGAGREYVRIAENFQGADGYGAQVAAKRNIILLMGSVPEPSPFPQQVYNTSMLFSQTGKLLASYRKVHLFDVAVESALDERDVNERESKRFVAGDEIVTAETLFGTIGLTICYDQRFPEIFRALALPGASRVTVPSNFTKTTGEAHWMTLLRARAIENGLFIVAPNQCGSFTGPEGGGFTAYGHSAVIDPWGRVLLEMDDQPGVGYAEIDLTEVERIRAAIPALQNRRPDVYGL